MDVHHETLVLERRYAAPPSRLYRAFADPREREIWSTPGPTAEVRIDASDMRTGGTESARCGSRGVMQWSVRTYYHYVEQDSVITFSEVVSEADTILTTALVTVEFIAAGREETELRLTDQVTSFAGASAIAGHRLGYSQALENLGLSLNKEYS